MIDGVGWLRYACWQERSTTDNLHALSDLEDQRTDESNGRQRWAAGLDDGQDGKEEKRRARATTAAGTW